MLDEIAERALELDPDALRQRQRGVQHPAEGAAEPAGGRAGGGLLVNVSRGIAGAATGDGTASSNAELVSRLSDAAQSWSEKLPVLP